jgi:hypothetical protein
MDKTTKTACVVLFVAVLLPLFVGQTHLSNAEERDYTSEVLRFLRDVVKVDLAKYNVTLVSGPSIDNPSWIGGLTRVYGKYNLTSETSWVEVLFKFVNGTLTYCTSQVRTGQLLLTESPKGSLVDAVDVFMQRYQAYTGDSSLNAMRSIVQNVDVSKTTTTTTTNLKLEVNVYSSTQTSFHWYNTIDGAAYSGINVGFENGVFNGFSDDRSYFRAAGAPVVVSEEQAVKMALDCAASFSLSYGGGEVKDLEVVESQVRSGLLTKCRTDVLVWYPYWKVIVPLAKAYPGGVSTIVVEIWADTAEVISVYPSGSDIGVEETPTPSASPTSPIPSASSTASASPTPEPSASVTSASTVSPSLTSQPTTSPSLQPSGNSGDQKGVDSTLLIVLAVVCAGVAFSAWGVLRSRRVRG